MTVVLALSICYIPINSKGRVHHSSAVKKARMKVDTYIVSWFSAVVIV